MILAGLTTPQLSLPLKLPGRVNAYIKYKEPDRAVAM